MSRPRAPRHLPHPNIASPHSLHTAFDATIYPFDSTNNNNQIMTVRFLTRLLTVASHNCCSKYSSDASRTVSQKQKRYCLDRPRTPRAHRSNPALLSTTCDAARRETPPSTATPRPRSPTRHHSRTRSNPSGPVELSRNSGLYSEYNVPIYDLNGGSYQTLTTYNIVVTPCVIQTAII